ncbi:hypothetical protein GGI07_003956 [Coemansia sp. Benny D115]|nr:hypothetical protein GGI07_003956 [Coemansia sp. Benny D115]
MANRNVTARSSVSDEDENFELVDYTAASSWERFVASIETKLCQWRVNDGRRGDFNVSELADKCRSMLVKRKQYKDAVLNQISDLCTRTARLSYKGASYLLVLSIHPLLAAAAAGQNTSKAALFDREFPMTHVAELEVDHTRGEPEAAWHPLHKWTGSSVLVYLRYLGDDNDWDADSVEDADNYTVSLETAKLLVSSLNIAARNVRCQLPMFAPVGDAWRCLFTGRLLGRATQIDKPSAALAVSQRHDTVSLPQAPNAYLQLSGLLELFVTSFNVDSYASKGAQANGEQRWNHISQSVELAALHEYRVKNTYSREWNATLPEFRFRAGDLNVGPANDPLRVLTLTALFHRAPCGTYIDQQPGDRDRLYLKTASAWLLGAQMFPADRERTMLTEALEDAFAAWAQASADTARHRHLNMAEQMEAHAEITGDMLVDLFGSTDAPHITPPGLGAGADDEPAARAFAALLDQTLAEVYTDPQTQPPSAARLIARMPHGAAVPANSLLWRLGEIILVATAKQSTNFWRAPSIMTFLRLLWAMALKEIRWRWEHLQPLPRIPTTAEHSASKQAATATSSSGTDTPDTEKPSLPPTNTQYGVHLSYALIHQKLEMLNCCIERKAIRNGQTIDSVRALISSDTPEPLGDSSLDHTGTQSNSGDTLAQRIRDHIKDQIRRRIGDAGVEMGQRAWSQSARIRRPIGRLLNTIRPHDTPEDGSAADFDEYEDVNPVLCESDSEGFVSAEDVDYSDSDPAVDSLTRDVSRLSSVPVQLPSASRRKGSADTTGTHTDSLTGHSAKDANYVDVAISSSMDSTSGFHHVSDVFEREKPLVMDSSSSPTANTTADTTSSTADTQQQAGVGGLYQSETLRLLDTDTPTWIPTIQLPPVLTEDMLREREAILIGLGTSSEGAKQRARLQCAELISDMQSFKAANPGCTLADFVRWHSPRDWIVPEGCPDNQGCLSVRMTGFTLS